MNLKYLLSLSLVLLLTNWVNIVMSILVMGSEKYPLASKSGKSNFSSFIFSSLLSFIHLCPFGCFCFFLYLPVLQLHLPVCLFILFIFLYMSTTMSMIVDLLIVVLIFFLFLFFSNFTRRNSLDPMVTHPITTYIVSTSLL